MDDVQPFWKQLEKQGVEHTVKKERDLSPKEGISGARLVTLRIPVSTHGKLKVLQAVDYRQTHKEKALHEIMDTLLDKEIAAKGISYK